MDAHTYGSPCFAVVKGAATLNASGSDLPEVERAEVALHERVRAERRALPPGPLFAVALGMPRQRALPFGEPW